MVHHNRRGAEEGQALVVVLIAVTLLSLIGTAITALWIRSVTLSQRQADEATALYAAEAGLAEGLARIFSGDASFLRGQGELTGEVGGGAYRVRVVPSAGESGSALAIVATGWPVARPEGARRTVRLVVDSPFFRPIVTAQDLTLLRQVCVPLIGCFDWPFSATFAPSALYGGKLTAGDHITGVQRGSARMPTLSYARVAAKVPVTGDPVPLSSKSGRCFIGTSGWFKLSDNCSSLTVAAPWAGVIGDVRLAHMTLNSGSVLVTAGDLIVTAIDFVQAQATRGGGVVVAGGRISLTTLDLARWGTSGPISLLALDTNTPDCSKAIPGCTYDPKNPDRPSDSSNSISISAFSLGSGTTSTQLVAFAAPFRVPPVSESRPEILIDIGSLLKAGETVFRGSLVSAGDVTVYDSSLISLASWTFQADPQLLGPVFQLASTLPNHGVVTQISWSEESGSAP